MRSHWVVVGLLLTVLSLAGCGPADEWNQFRGLYTRLDAQETRVVELETAVSSAGAISALAEEPTSSAAAPVVAEVVASPEVSGVETMASLLTVEVTDTQLLPVDIEAGRYSAALRLYLTYRNTGTVGIRAFTGTVVFSDLFDRQMKTAGLTYDQTIGPGSTVTDSDKSLDLNQFMASDQWLGTTEFENMRITFEPESILFVDGTRLGEVN